MALFAGNLKVEIAEANAKIATLERQVQTIEIEKRAVESERDQYKQLLAGDDGKIVGLKEQIIDLTEKSVRLNNSVEKSEIELGKTIQAIEEKKKEFIVLDDAILLQSFGLYQPKYDFATSIDYKGRLDEIRASQNDMIKNGTAAVCLKQWSIEGSAVKGKKFTEDSIKQILKTFNLECENAISKVRFSNYDSTKKRIDKSFESLNKLNATNKVELQQEFLELKHQELDLAYEYAQKVQEEKEELRTQRELRREELKLAKELEEKRAEIEKEQQHYNNALTRLVEQIECEKSEERLDMLLQKKSDIENNLTDLETALKEVDYREANQRAGYVYIISNIGAFGENIYKIGMTRRLEPQDRVDELGGASVPFRFDIHALIFSDDAPKLESALHHAFEDRKVNMINSRKEFFRVTLEEIEAVVKANHDKTVDFKYAPDAEQYRESLLKVCCDWK